MAWATDIPYRVLTTITTPATEELRCIHFDRQGMLWMGFDTGLRSFDGYQTRTYRSDAYTSKIFPNNTVLCMTEDNDGQLWLGTRNGIVRMDKATGRFTTYHLPSPQQRIIYTMFASRDGTLYVGTDGGLSRYVKSCDTFHTYLSGRMQRVDLAGRRLPSVGYSVKSIVEDRLGNLFVGTWSSGLMRFNPSTGVFVQYPQHNELNSAYSLFIDSRQRLWVGTWGYGIECLERPYHAANLGWKTYGGRRGYFDTYYKILEDPVSGSIWACCREGVSILDLRNGQTVFADHRVLAGNAGEPLNFSNDMATDGHGNIWIGTLEDGVKHVDTRRSLFRFNEVALSGSTLPASSVVSIHPADGQRFWLGLRPYGLALYDRQTGQTRINGAIGGLGAIDPQVMTASITSVVRRFDGSIWLASGSYGVVVVPPTGAARMERTGQSRFVFDDYVNTLYGSRDGRIWIGQRSCASVAQRDGSGRRLVMREKGVDFSTCDVRGFAEDRAGNIWISTENEGIIRYRNGQSHRYGPADGSFPVLDAINCYEDSRGKLWAISRSGGLFLYDKVADRFVPVNREYGIEGSSVYAINEDRWGRLWLATEGALVSIAFIPGQQLPQVVNFSDEDGLPYLVFTPNATSRRGNELCFGTRRGFYSFVPPAKLAVEGRRVSLVVTDIAVDDEPFEQLDSALRTRISECLPRYTRSITLPASVNKLSIEFSLLSYVSQQRIKYAYQLEGYDSNWHYTGNGVHRATYGNLPAGTYRFLLRGIDSYGHRIDLPYAIEVRVLPPWYWSWWAWVIYLMLAAGAVYGLVKWYERYLNTRHRLQMNHVFTNITHELLTPLMVMSASIDELRLQAPAFSRNYNVVQNNIARLSRMLRQMLEVRKSLAGQLRLKVSEGDLTAFLQQECDNIAPMGIARDQQIEQRMAEVRGWFDRDKVDKIVYNLLSNALKYSREGGKVVVSLVEREGQAILRVSDEGVGIAPHRMKHLFTRFFDGDYRRANTEGTGLGLSLTRDLAVLHHGRVECESRENVGTTFTVTFPLRREAYAAEEIDDAAVAAVSDLVAVGGMQPEPLAPEVSEEEKEYAMLIVEDNVELLGLMSRMLGRKYRVYTARDGRQALGLIERQELDIVISDVMMPGMDGFELTRRIKESDSYAQLPVILLTARTSDEDRKTGYRAGADEYLAKPFRMEDLDLRVANIIRNRERIRERFRASAEPEIPEGHLSSPDEIFLQKAFDCVKEHLAEYDRESFARDMCVSSSTLYNKLRALTGQNISSFIMSVRIKEACRIARREPDIHVGELAMRVGIGTPKYFAKCFKEETGMSPSDYLRQMAEPAEQGEE